MERQGRRLALALVAFAAAGGCDFQPDPPEGPSALPVTRLVSVTIEYRQPAGCVNAAGTCAVSPVFFASWMGRGDEVILTTAAGPSVWSGTVHNVPVNWPPTDEPHYVRVWDPHLLDTPNEGLTAARLTVGGQAIAHYDQPGTPQEAGLIYVDDNGIGRNPL
jgi:hypothetical protein